MPTNRFSKNALMYEGSVKRIYSSGASSESAAENLLFEFTDDYSVFDWGKMPDTIPRKGQALARLTSSLYEKLEDPKEWQRFGKIKSIPEELCQRGLLTHYRGFDQDATLLVRKINICRPQKMTEMGREYYIYPPKMQPPYLIPLEVVFRFEVGAGSSLTKRHPEYQSGHLFNPPYVEMFTKLEEKDRPLEKTEAMKMSGLSSEKYQEMVQKTILVAEILKFWLEEKSIRLVDGKFEWGLTAKGELMLVDAIGPDELRLEKNGVQLSKEVLRDFYRQTARYREVENAKENHITNWKAKVSEPPSLPDKLRNLVSQMYQSLVDEILGQNNFSCSSLNSITEEFKCKLWS